MRFSSSSSSSSSSSTNSPFSTRNLEELIALDQQHVWHPYASLPSAVPSYPVTSAVGCELHLATPSTTNSGTTTTTLIDGMSSWWACIHGYNHPVLNQAMKDQIDRMSHVMFGGLTHEPAILLAQRLVEITPTPLQHVFFCDSGSVSIEVAMKMALQYWYHVNRTTRKHRFLTVLGGYHGDTFQAMSVCDPVNGMHHMFSSVLKEQIFAPRPDVAFDEEWPDAHNASKALQAVRELLHRHSHEIAAVILEPIVQGAGGMRFYHAIFLKCIRELCNEHEVLLICDEIATGFGRTGELFACQHVSGVKSSTTTSSSTTESTSDDEMSPDIMCIGKALSGGQMSFAATLTTTKIAEQFSDGGSNGRGVFMHGPTFMGNPLACAVSLASLNLLLSPGYAWKTKVKAIERQLQDELEPCRESPYVQNVRVLGAIGVVELKEPVDMTIAQPAVVEQGVWLRPFGKLLYTMPPFVITSQQLRQITTAMVNLSRRKLR